MLLSLAQWLQTLSPEFGFLRVFQYLTFRAVHGRDDLAADRPGLRAVGDPPPGRAEDRPADPRLRRARRTWPRRGTPTMGGVLILLGIGVSTLLWFDWSNRFVWIVMLVTFGFGAIGWVDDWRKVVQQEPRGHALAREVLLAVG